MGRFKTPKQKSFAKLAKVAKQQSDSKSEMDTASVKSHKRSVSVSGRSTKSKSIFEKLDVDMESLTKDLEVAVKNQLSGNKSQSLIDGDDGYFDTRSVVTSKSMKGLGLKKKEKLKFKNQIWKKKVDIIENQLKEMKAKKKRKATVVVGDMKPLEDALPTLEWLNNNAAAKKKPTTKPRSIQKTNKIKKQKNDFVNFFQAVLKDPTYKADPIETITKHVKETMETN